MSKYRRFSKSKAFGSHQRAEHNTSFKSGLTDDDVRLMNPLLIDYFREDREALVDYLRRKVQHLKQTGCEFPPGFNPDDFEQVEAIARRGSEILLG